MSTFPGAIPSYSTMDPNQTLSAAGHTARHNAVQGDLVAVATKVGTGAATPASGKVLKGNGTGSSTWGAVDLTTDVTGIMPVGSGGTGTNSVTGSGSVVYSSGAAITSPTITGPTVSGGSWDSPTLTTPTIASFTFAQHNHTNSAGGGQLGTAALTNAAVTADKLSLGPAGSYVVTDESTTSASYVDLATVQSVTVTIGANGIALMALTAGLYNVAAVKFASVALSGANTVAASDNWGIRSDIAAFDNYTSVVYLFTGLTPGSTTFTFKAKTASGTAHFFGRTLTVVPL